MSSDIVCGAVVVTAGVQQASAAATVSSEMDAGAGAQQAASTELALSVSGTQQTPVSGSCSWTALAASISGGLLCGTFVLLRMAPESPAHAIALFCQGMLAFHLGGLLEGSYHTLVKFNSRRSPQI